MKSAKAAKATRASRILILCSFLSLSLGSCTSFSVQEACQIQFPKMEQEFTEVRGNIGRELATRDPDHYNNRSLASVGASVGASGGKVETPHKFFSLDDGEKAKWQDWSTDQLKVAERYLDYVRTSTEMRGAREPLSDLAERLVDFNGYSERGELYQMREALQKAQDDADRAARAGCPAH